MKNVALTRKRVISPDLDDFGNTGVSRTINIWSGKIDGDLDWHFCRLEAYKNL